MVTGEQNGYGKRRLKRGEIGSEGRGRVLHIQVPYFMLDRSLYSVRGFCHSIHDDIDCLLNSVTGSMSSHCWESCDPDSRPGIHIHLPMDQSQKGIEKPSPHLDTCRQVRF